MENQGADVFLAADGPTYDLLKKEFPNTVILRLFGYKIRYSHHKKYLALKLATQLPKILYLIRREKKWLTKFVREYQPDSIISDNRFGLYYHNIPCVYMTHQLRIMTGRKFTDWFAQKFHQNYINKYTHCWVPDFESNGLAGELSHANKVFPSMEYIGALSRFKPSYKTEIKYSLLISISGPEPQRTIFENLVLKQLTHFEKRVLVVRGLPGNYPEILSENPSIEIVNHLPSKELNVAFCQSAMIICRSGYSTIMDLVKIKKQAILVPTPGQKEQEYLAEYLMGKKYFFSVAQQDFDLQNSLLDSKKFGAVLPDYDLEIYKKTLSAFIENIISNPMLLHSSSENDSLIEPGLT
ncbi:MAG: glycosyltransferase [Ginsengibacter sp.]